MRLSLFWKIVSLTFLFSSVASAQLSLKGRVLERGTLKPLGNVNIYILPEGLKATTDGGGYFSFNEVPSGEREWIVTMTGYKRLKKKYTYSDAKSDIKLYVERKSYVEFETTVVGKVDKKDPVKRTLKREQFLKMPGSGGDPIRAIENLPGVAQSYDAEVAIQGSPPEDTKYLVEGHEIPYMFHFQGLNTVAVPETVESIDFLSAGYGPEFGRASSGIINLNLREPRTDRTHAMGFVDFTATGGFVEGKIGKDASKKFFIGGRYSYLGQVFKLVTESSSDEDGETPTFNTAPTYFDINAAYHQQLSDRFKFKFITLASKDKVSAIVENSEEDITFSGSLFYERQFYRLIPKLEFRISDSAKASTSFAYGSDREEFSPNNQHVIFKANRLSWRSDYENELTSFYKLYMGTDFILEDYDIDIKAPISFFNEGEEATEIPESLAEKLIDQQTGTDVRQGYFLRNEFSLFNKRLVISPNIRFDHFELHDKGYFQPRLGTSYKFSDDMKVYLNTGLYYQPQTPFNMNQGTGNPNLTPSKSTHYSVKFEKDFRKGSNEGFTTSGGFFYKKLDDLLEWSSEQVFRNGEYVPERYNNRGRGDSKGFETMIQYKTGRTNINLGYTYTVSKRIDDDGREYPALQDQTHNLNLTSSYSWDNWSIGSRFRYVTGNPYTPVTGGVYYENSDTYLPVTGRKLEKRFDPFWQLDLRVDRKWVYDTWILSLYLDIQNITNRKNVTEIEYKFDYSESREATGLPILPTFGVKGEF